MPYTLTTCEEDFERLDELIEDSGQLPGHQGGRNNFSAWIDHTFPVKPPGGDILNYVNGLSKDSAIILAKAMLNEDIPTLRKVIGIKRLGAAPKALEVDLGFKSLTTKAMEVLMKELPVGLENFTVDLKGNQLMLSGIKAVATGLPKNLTVLQVDIAQNRLGAEGVEAFMKAVPPSVVKLTLGVSGMRMGLPGVKAIADHLPPGLEELNLEICDGLMGDDGCVYLSRRLPKTMKSLYIWMRGEQGYITNRGHWIFDRLFNDELNPHNLPDLTMRNYKNVRNLEEDNVQQYVLTANTWELVQRWAPNENVC